MVQSGLGVVVDAVKLLVWHLELDHLLLIYLKFVAFDTLGFDSSVGLSSSSFWINEKAPFAPVIAVSPCSGKASQHSLILQ